MSFSVLVKDEAAQLELKNSCCQRAELAALARVVGVIRIGRQQKLLIMTTEVPSVARRIFRLAKNLGWTGLITVRRYERPRHHRLFTIQIPLEEDDRSLLCQLGFTEGESCSIPSLEASVLEKVCCKRAFLRGSFLGCGFLSDPKNAYHMELMIKTREGVEEVTSALSSFNLTPGCRERKDVYGVYLKEADQVSEFLRVIGTNQALLRFENCRVVKDMRNQVNRLVNCETANMDKAVEAGLKQVAVIKEIDSSVGLGVLRPPLRELALLRLHYPGASLSELGKLLTPPVGKSGVNHRFREIFQIAEKLRKQKDDCK
jgi:DNA-binding protein WhiA